MPNWYLGTAIIRGDIHIFKKWAINKLLKNEELKDFAQTFAPLSTDEWNFGSACKEWGVKWDFPITISIGLDEEDEEFEFTFMSAWNSPCFLWKQLETKYNVEVEEFGFEEGDSSFYKYKNGRENYKKIDNNLFEDKFNFKPSKEALENEDTYEDELCDHKNDNWSDAFYMWHTMLDNEDKNWKEVKLEI